MDSILAYVTVLREAGDPREVAAVLSKAIESAKTDGRAEDLAELRRRQAGVEAELEGKRRARRAATVIRHLGGQMGLPAEEIRQLTTLPLEERLRAVDALGRRFVNERVSAEGLPSGLTPGEWSSWSELDDDEFLRRAAAFGLLPGAPGAPGEGG